MKDLCPDCGHEAHSSGDRECETPVHHGPSRFHLCLCLNQAGADKACPPQMTCQGGSLGYSDVYYLQRGIAVQSRNGLSTPDALGTPICPGGTCYHPVDTHSVYGCEDGCGCVGLPGKTGKCSDPPCGYLEGERCDTHATEQAHAAGDHQWCDITCEDHFPSEQLRNMILYSAIPGSRNALKELERRAAASRPGVCPSCSAGIKHTNHCPTPLTHNWGCGCPTDPETP